ncbi:MAG: fibronectin-binding domain-containing protein [Thaumarchaeota archaeon]|nr:fibronectin-binding domain-containing protein [Nitrososphaerota archaeon]
MTLTGIELRYLVNEISEKTHDYYVSNIYGITRDSFLFKLHHPEKQDVMLMLSSFGLWISSVKIEPLETNKLLKVLRGSLLRLKLAKIQQIGAERIVYLTFSGFDKEYVLVGEFFGDGNIILCNKEMKILALLHSIDVRHRKLGIGLQYTPPPQNSLDVFNFYQKDLEGLLSSEIQVSKWIGRTLGLPTKYVEYICKLAKIDSKVTGNDLTNNDVKKIFDSIKKTVENVVEGNHEPVIVRDDKVDVYPLKFDHKNEEYTSVQSFMIGLDTVFTETLVNVGKSTKTNVASEKITELENKLTEQTKAVSLVNEKSFAITKIANSLLDLVSKGIFSISDPKLQKTLKDQNCTIIKEKGNTYFLIHNSKIKLDTNSSLQALASVLFNESKRQKAAIASIEKLQKKTEKDLEKLKKQVEVSKESITITEVRKKNWYERYRWFNTSDGTLAIGGRDSSSNMAIIRKHLQNTDRVFHAEIFGSPFFILKAGKETTDSSLNEVAHATVCFSRAWREAMYGLKAFWVNPEQVKKGAPSGQFLSKGSFVLDGQRNYVRVSTLKLGVGLLKQDDRYIVICGPPTCIKKNCVCYSMIEPGGSEMTDAAKKIKSEFVNIKGDLVKSISIDDFVRVLPAGESHVTESGSVDSVDE